MKQMYKDADAQYENMPTQRLQLEIIMRRRQNGQIVQKMQFFSP